MYDVKENGVLKTVESWSVVIPLYDNDGHPFDAAIIDSILSEILLNYPGFSLTNSVGYWKGDRKTYIDQNYQVLIDAIPDNVNDSSSFFAALKQELQGRLHQEKIYITKQESKQEFLSFAEFFDEVGIEAETDDAKQEAHKIIKQLAGKFDFVLQRLGYETTALRRNVENKKIVWERKLCGIKIKSEFDDSLPEKIKLIAADQVVELGDALAGDEPFAIVGSYEFQAYILKKSSYRSLVIAGKEFSVDQTKVYCYSPFGEPLSLKRFIEEFTMSVFTNWLILREEGFLTKEISLSVGGDGSLQWTTSDRADLLLRSPASIPEDEVQKEIIRCLVEAIHSYEDNWADPLAVLQAKAKNNYILKRAIVRHTIKNRSAL
jgi:hypothetical protein